jgi:hypothetical protein
MRLAAKRDAHALLHDAKAAVLHVARRLRAAL